MMGKVEYIRKLEHDIENLKRKNLDLSKENETLKYCIQDIQATNEMIQKQVGDMRDIIEDGVAAECGCVVLEGASRNASYQDFVGILLHNGYGVELQPINMGKSLKIIIKEGEQ